MVAVCLHVVVVMLLHLLFFVCFVVLWGCLLKCVFFLCCLYWVAACPVPWLCAVCYGLLLVAVGLVISVACLLCVV